MWIPKWLWERYKELRLKIGLNISFSFKQAKEIFSYDSDEMIYKTLNKLEQLDIIIVKRSKTDKRAKTYKIVLELKDIPYADITIPTDYPQEHPDFLASTGSAAIFGITPLKPSIAFHKMYNKDGQQQVTIVPKPAAKTIEEYLIDNIKSYKSVEPILSIIIKEKIDFDKVIRELNSYQRRYLGALLEILNKHKEIKDKLYELTKKDKREFSIFPRKVKKIPKKYEKIAKKWRVYLNIDVVNTDEL
jgi:hypothetical protein